VIISPNYQLILSFTFFSLKRRKSPGAGDTPVILATQEAEIRRIMVQSQPRQIVLRDPISKSLSQKWAGGVVQDVGSEFKPQYCNNNNNNKYIKEGSKKFDTI
jgi:hypothetical protein